MRNASPKSRLLPGEMEVHMFEELFDGISVSESVRTIALEMLHADSKVRRELVALTRDANLDKQIAMMRRRDARIRTLLSSAEATARFDRNAALAEQKRAGDDPMPATCARQP
jgi:hypothetical protein